MNVCCSCCENPCGDAPHEIPCPTCQTGSASELADLRRWKAEALPVIAGLQELGRALGLPLGEQITGPRAVEAAERLRAERDRAVEALAGVWDEGYDQGCRDDASANPYRDGGSVIDDTPGRGEH